MSSHIENPRIIVALDFDNAGEALALTRRLDPKRCRVKVGKELFTRAGPAPVEKLTAAGFDVFLDLKFHDIPNTVAAACAAAADLGCWMINVHASGGQAMMMAARESMERYPRRPLLVAVTVLTSLAAEDLAAIGMKDTPEAAVSRLAALTHKAGLDGVVCSAHEAASLRRELPRDFLLVTPGIRPAGGDAADQARVATPAEALRAGADYLVIGRPVTRAADPLQALAGIEREIDGV
ncbi:MAG TPA: orotidine-5'-phosphate decarboxylase [Gammaproteobacteria bacterium]|nr:orotidine-5'-phosphate decarboxylase [Gammaproteobacteria bacterium]